MIQNPLVKVSNDIAFDQEPIILPEAQRRTGARPVTAAPPALDIKVLANVTSKAMLNTITTKTETDKTSSLTDPPEAKPDVKQSQSTGTNKKMTTKPPAIKREQSSIFKQHSKAKPKITREGTGSSVDTSPTVTIPQSVGFSKVCSAGMPHLPRLSRKLQVSLKTVCY